MKKIALSLALSGVMFATLAATGPSVTGTYVEARTAEVFAGACIMNGEAATGGREALLAWKVDRGQVNGVALDGLAVVAALAGDTNLGYPRNRRRIDARARGHLRRLARERRAAQGARRDGEVALGRAHRQRRPGDRGADPVRRQRPSDHRLDRHHEAGGGQTAQPRRELRQQAVVQSADAGRSRGDGHDRSERVQRPRSCNTKWSDPNKRSSFFGTFSY